MLPDIDGFAICDQLKRNRETNLIPIIMVTALHDAEPPGRGRPGRGQRLPRPSRSPPTSSSRPSTRPWPGTTSTSSRGTTGEINFDIRSELTYLQQANDMLADLYAHTPLTERQIKDLKQAVMEMGGNAIEWGHRKNADLVLRITYRIDPEAVTLIIQRPGARLQPRRDLPTPPRTRTRSATSTSATSWASARAASASCSPAGLVDEFRYNDKGNEVTLIKRFDQPAAGEG